MYTADNMNWQIVIKYFWFDFYQISSFIEYYMYINKQYTMTSNKVTRILLDYFFENNSKLVFDIVWHEWLGLYYTLISYGFPHVFYIIFCQKGRQQVVR